MALAHTGWVFEAVISLRVSISHLPLASVFSLLPHWSANTFIPHPLMLIDVPVQGKSSAFSIHFRTNPSPKSCKLILHNCVTRCTRPSNSSPCLFSSPPHFHQSYQPPPLSVSLLFLLLKYGWSLCSDLCWLPVANCRNDDFDAAIRPVKYPTLE